MKRFLFVLFLLVLAGCWSQGPAPASCAAVDRPGLVPLECDDFLRSGNASFVLMLDRHVQSASFSEPGVSCARTPRGRSMEVVCSGVAAGEPVAGNVSGLAFFDNASRPYVVRVRLP